MIKDRKNKPISITLSPQAKEAINIIKDEKQISNTSGVLDYALLSTIKSLGYQIKVQENNMEYLILQDNLPSTNKNINNDNDVLVDIFSLSDSNLVKLNKYIHNQDLFVEAPKGGEYLIRITNNSYKRKLFMISVDGRNVLNGEYANIHDGNGYVLDPYQSMDVKGWRRTSSEVASFEFVDAADSYDEMMGGNGSNLGVIGIAVFEEEEKNWNYWEKIITDKRSDHWPCKEYWPINNWPYPKLDYYWSTKKFIITCNTSNISNETINSSFIYTDDGVENKIIGTAYGKPTKMKTSEIKFIKKSKEPEKVMEIRYATRDILVSWGVIPSVKIPQVKSFPVENISSKEPPKWRWKNGKE